MGAPPEALVSGPVSLDLAFRPGALTEDKARQGDRPQRAKCSETGDKSP